MKTMYFPRFSGTAILDPSVVVRRQFSSEGQAIYTQVREVLKKHEDYVASLPDFVKVEVASQPLARVECRDGYVGGQPQETVQLSYQSDFGIPVTEKFAYPLVLSGSTMKGDVEKRANNPQEISVWVDAVIKKALPQRAKLFGWDQKAKEKDI